MTPDLTTGSQIREAWWESKVSVCLANKHRTLFCIISANFIVRSYIIIIQRYRILYRKLACFIVWQKHPDKSKSNHVSGKSVNQVSVTCCINHTQKSLNQHLRRVNIRFQQIYRQLHPFTPPCFLTDFGPELRTQRKSPLIITILWWQ